MRTKHLARAFMQITIMGLMAINISAQTQVKTIDLFEESATRVWNSITWPNIDPGLVEYSTEWNTQGSRSMKLTNLEATDTWSGYEVIDTDPQSIAQIKLDIFNDCNIAYQLRFEIFNESGAKIKEQTLNMAANTPYLEYSINIMGSVKKIMLFQDFDAQGQFVTTYIDNIRFVIGGQEVLWDDCESGTGVSWYVTNDAVTGSSGTYTTSLYSPGPEFNSTASMIMQWGATVDLSTTKAELKTDNASEDLTGYDILLVDVYRPSSTNPNVRFRSWIWGSVSHEGTDAGIGGVTVDQADTWTTIELPFSASVTDISQIVLIVDSTNKYTTGTLYFDNLRASKGGVYPQETILNPLPNYVHMLKNYEDRDTILTSNWFYGQTGVGQSSYKDTSGVFHNFAEISQVLSNEALNGSHSVALTYDVTVDTAFVYYNHKLSLNSAKDRFAIHMKTTSEDENPGTVTLQFKDKDNRGSDHWSGAEILLHGITTDWQQWVVDINNASFTIFPEGFDHNNITEVVLVIGHANSTAKTGTLLIDDITFIDVTDERTAYRGHALPEPNITSSLPPYYFHVIKDFEDSDTTLLFNKFYGESGVGQSSYKDTSGVFHNTAELSQTLFTPSINGNGVALTYDILADTAFVYYNHKLSLNSEKNKFAISMKATSEAENPGTVVLQFKDKYNRGGGNWTGINCLLHGITTEWQQWIVDIDTLTRFLCSEAGYVGMDISNITEMVVVVDYVNSSAKTGALLIDDLTFIDQTDELIGLKPNPGPGDTLISSNWDDPSLWVTSQYPGSTVRLDSFPGVYDDGIIMDYDFTGGGWANMKIAVDFDPTTHPLAFYIKHTTSNNLDVKFIDENGSVFGTSSALLNNNEWSRIVVYLNNMNYLHSGDHTFGKLDTVEIAIAGSGKTKIFFDEIGIAPASTPNTLGQMWDTDSTLAGIGFDQRRDLEMTPEDTLILQSLKELQDESPESNLIPSQAGEDIIQTFNNALVAMAFIVKDEKVRAERILDFFANATDTNNTDIRLQNFYYNGEARGFYQQVSLSTYRDETGTVDRWMGDMVWLLCAYKYYEDKYNSDKYNSIITLLKDLLVSFYSPAGYIQSGWRNGDSTLHEASGHHEGNIDAYTVLKTCGVETEIVNSIKDWLEDELTVKRENKNLPLDLYTWRVLAYNGEQTELLNIAEYDFRYRKTMILNDGNDTVVGLYSQPESFIDNIWVDGTGHIACAYIAYGDLATRQRGYFYANQMDKMIIEEEINGVMTHSLPYSLNNLGAYAWVDTKIGFPSCAAWYIFAKNSFNPFNPIDSSVYNINLNVPYIVKENDEYSGAACAKIILDYEAGNNITQSDIQQYGTAQNYSSNIGNDFIDPYGMYRSLNHFEFDADYNYAQMSRNSKEEAYRDICYWISNTIPNTNREHLPSVIPINGSFNDWFVINGFQSSVNPHEQSDYTVFGFYVSDPRYDGVGQNMFIQANTFSTYYYHPINSSDIWNGKYVSVNEPPEEIGTISIQMEQEISEPNTNELRYLIAENGFENYDLENNSAISEVLANGYERDRIYFVDLEGILYDYYIVSYTRAGAGGVIIVAVIDANNGALKLVSYNGPDYDYYTYLDNYNDATILKSSKQNEKSSNILYPVKSNANITNVSKLDNAKEYDFKLELIPNPASDFIRLDYSTDQAGMVNISIYNLTGKVVKTVANSYQQAGNHTLETSVQDFETGIYMCRFTNGKKLVVKKLVVSK